MRWLIVRDQGQRIFLGIVVVTKDVERDRWIRRRPVIDRHRRLVLCDRDPDRRLHTRARRVRHGQPDDIERLLRKGVNGRLVGRGLSVAEVPRVGEGLPVEVRGCVREGDGVRNLYTVLLGVKEAIGGLFSPTLMAVRLVPVSSPSETVRTE